MEKYLIGLSIAIGLYILFKLFNRSSNDTNKEINEILDKEEYKVKGQYD